LEDLETIKKNSFITITDPNFIGYSKQDIEDRKILLEKIIRKDFKFTWGCQTTVKMAEDPELLGLMRRAGCFAVFTGIESFEEADLKGMRKNQNVGKDYADIVSKIHKHKIGVVASCIIGLDTHKKGYYKVLAEKLKKIKVDFVDIKYMTAFPGTPAFYKLEQEGRVNRNWLEMDPIKPSIQLKHFTKNEIIKERENTFKTFFSIRNIIRILARWMFVKDSPPIGFFIKMALFRKYLKK